MKTLLFLLLLAVACQPNQTARHPARQPDSATATVESAEFGDTLGGWGEPASHKSSTRPVRFGKVLRKDVVSHPVVDEAEINRFFEKHDLSSLIKTVKGRQDDRSMNGFRGPNQYRTEVVVLSARRDLQNPLAYHVTGMSRTKRRIAGFQGQITFDSLAIEPLLSTKEENSIESARIVKLIRLGNSDQFKIVRRYSVAGWVVLKETSAVKQASAFEGRVVMEIALNKSGKIYLDAPFLHGPSQGGEQKYTGVWKTYQTGQLTSALWVDNIIGYGPFIHEDFVIGEREVQINPKYAKQGWNSYWENEEWWAEKHMAQR